MLLKPTAVRARRRGMTIVECALVMSIFLMFLFGILEYARYMFTLHLTTNAARDAARYGSVRVNANPALISTADTAAPYSASKKAYDVPEITDYLKQRMGPKTGSVYYADQLVTGMNVRVFPCNTAVMYDDPPTLEPKPSNTGWNNAGFSERIAVRVTGTYVPILPSFLWMGNTSSMDIIAVMGSEG